MYPELLAKLMLNITVSFSFTIDDISCNTRALFWEDFNLELWKIELDISCAKSFAKSSDTFLLIVKPSKEVLAASGKITSFSHPVVIIIKAIKKIEIFLFPTSYTWIILTRNSLIQGSRISPPFIA